MNNFIGRLQHLHLKPDRLKNRVLINLGHLDISPTIRKRVLFEIVAPGNKNYYRLVSDSGSNE